MFTLTEWNLFYYRSDKERKKQFNSVKLYVCILKPSIESEAMLISYIINAFHYVKKKSEWRNKLCSSGAGFYSIRMFFCLETIGSVQYWCSSFAAYINLIFFNAKVAANIP